MSARRRAVETRWSRDAVNDGTADAVAFGAMSIGLVLGTLDKLWPTSIPTVRYEHGIAMSSSIAAHAEEAATAPIDAVQPMSADAAEVGLASSPVHGLDHVSFEPSAPLVDRSQESKAAYESPEQLAPRPLADYTSDAGQQPMSISGSAHHDSHSGDAPDVLSVAPPAIEPMVAAAVQPAVEQVRSLLDDIGGLWSPLQHVMNLGEPVAQPIVGDIAPLISKGVELLSQDQPVSNTVGSLLEQVKSLPDSIEALSSSVQHVTDLGQVAAQPILHDVASATSDVASATAKEGIDLLSEVLGGPPADPATDNQVAALPATILGAATDNISAAGHAGDSPLPALPSFDAAHLESLQVGGAPTASHDDVHALETPPLQLGFLGQSYIDVADHHHDNGSHTLSSPVHGFI